MVALIAEDLLDLSTISELVFANRHNGNLTRREPEGPFASKMLDEDCGKTLHRAKDGAMDDDRAFLLVLATLNRGSCVVLEAEADGKLEVELDRRALVLASERIKDIDVDLGAIECAVRV